jgi:hypothetical protein
LLSGKSAIIVMRFTVWVPCKHVEAEGVRLGKGGLHLTFIVQIQSLLIGIGDE